jgi:hypothetical protein
VRNPFDINHDYDATMLNPSAWPAETPTRRPFGGRVARVLEYPGGTPAPIGPGKSTPTRPGQPTVLRSAFGAQRELIAANLPKDNPGPGSNFDEGRDHVPAGALPRGGRPDLWDGMVQISPSPGQYEPHGHEAMDRRALLRIQNPAFKCRERRESLTNLEPNPGPAAYYARPAKGTGGVKQFAKSVRFTNKNYVGPHPMNDAPSPASYTIEPNLRSRHSSQALVDTRAALRLKKVRKGQM